MTTHTTGDLGRFFEDFAVGDTYRHPIGRTISETDNIWFTMLTGNTNQMHFNSHYASHSTFGKPLVNSGFTVAVVLGLSVLDISQNAIANLGWEQISLPHPVFVGDTLYGESIVTDLRESASRPYAGIVSVHTRGLNQNGDVCVSFDRTVMVYRRSAPQHTAHFPSASIPIADVVASRSGVTADASA